jgi:hypothetical protein
MKPVIENLCLKMKSEIVIFKQIRTGGQNADNKTKPFQNNTDD